jgi:hypothetical protein
VRIPIALQKTFHLGMTLWYVFTELVAVEWIRRNIVPDGREWFRISVLVEWDFNSRFKCWLNWHTIKLYLSIGTLYVDLRPVSCKTVIVWILYLPFHDDSMDKSRNTISSVKPSQLFWSKSFPPAWKTKWCGRISEITLSHLVPCSFLFPLLPLIP